MTNSSIYIWVASSILAALGVWLMLPRGANRGRVVGALLSAVALGLAASRAPIIADWAVESVFAILAVITIVSAAAAVTCRNPIYCAIWFGLTLIATAGLFLLNGAQFLAAATIVVYAGAILVTFLFLLMLAQPDGKSTYDRVSWESLLSAVVGMGVVCVLTLTIAGAFAKYSLAAESVVGAANSALRPPKVETIVSDRKPEKVLTPQHTVAVGTELFGKHVVAIEVSGVLLTAAIVGAAAITSLVAPSKRKENN